jgi:hypothetical protein
MAKKKRLSPNQKAELKRNLAGLKTIANYAPTNPEFKTEAVEAVDEQLDVKDDEIDQTEAHMDELRGESADIGDVYSKKMKGVRQQVIAQFGDDSPEYEAVGGIRASNRKSGLHRGKGDNNDTPNG